MIEKLPKLIWGVVAFGIYLFVVWILVFYFNTRDEKKSKHYVKKDEHRIQVALSSSKSLVKNKVTKPKAIKPKPKIKPKTVTKKKVIKKKVQKKKPIKKKIIEKKIKKKKIIRKKDVNLKKVKKKKAIDLFSKIEVSKKKKVTQTKTKPIKVKTKNNKVQVKNIPKSASERISDSIKKQKKSEQGEENIYFAKVEKLLRTWPARSDFLGQRATVTLYIKPTGKFVYKVTSVTENTKFSTSVVDFLNQLKKIGFGSHDAGRTYEFKVEFSTKE